MGRIVTIDLEKVLASGNDLKAKSPSGLTTHADLLGLASDVSKDPVSYLSSVGVQLDDQTATMLRSKLATRSGGVQAGTIHIDIL
ncbi:hypothetical protein ACVIW2_003281 [Bradyrhizobium huanghuaihaiense]|uniref:Uncharacterized protein n=1 Tax=Bradyrhizobium huanghuaihaiense TaxID=990078 RepID=A0A562QUA3_9BRAD|nr:MULTISPECIES: hypothetical protein [Bradyrhizobium]MBR0709889.1 hypothetical protein [Bradyrhizobium liaoningense]MDA9402773.1 hypothetical protein [Bradyrhizobium sp. CCBAU 45389]TWI60327.1 hypothetical protein IQ16_07711 [Bradyrhizobium huanghuaihaiense]UWU74733.1 hypothetical protein N2603_32470 [Bradyrhizobium sp. CB3035]WFU22916.1 hypothetical protein QA649_33260 [Bradyrhizobium sp. CB1717]